MVLQACRKSVDAELAPPVVPGDTTTPLKEEAGFPVGVAISYSPMLNDPRYAEIVNRDFDGVTFDYQMKHGAIVQQNGTMDFTRTDALVQAIGPMRLFGHTLAWHANQNASYLKTFSGLISAAGTELLANPGFESGLSGWTTFNSGNPAGTATITTATAANEVHEGSGALKVVNPSAYPGNPWRVQVSSDAFSTTPGKQYLISCWVKAASAGGSIRLSTGPTAAQYQADQQIGTAWQPISWIVAATAASTTFLFDLGEVANTYYIDDASVREVLQASGPDVAGKLDEALRTFITTVVNRYKDKVSEWDVVNELFAENGSLRNNSNTNTTAADLLVWSHYLGRDYALKAFRYAAAADPNAVLYINDYNLETHPAKLDSLTSMVSELKAKGAKVDGIGTQMHIAWNTPQSGIDAMFRKLAATGLKIRISELDVTAGSLTPQSMANQAAMVKYVVQSYLTHVPKAQQAGITVWGVTDNTSWLYNNGTQYPLLYDNNYNRKPAYVAFLQALRSKK